MGLSRTSCGVSPGSEAGRKAAEDEVPELGVGVRVGERIQKSPVREADARCPVVSSKGLVPFT